MNNLTELKVAIVCDWLVGYGGAERVVLELHKMFPKAPIYTSQYDPDAVDWFKDADVRTSWLQKLPKTLRKFLPVLRAWSFSKLDLKEYDLVISSSGAEAKFIKQLKPSAKHICYCHSPTHYYWIRYDEYMKNPGFGALDPLAKLGLKLLVGPMRRWDYKAAQRPTTFIANSTFTQSNIKEYYGRESLIIHPPVDIDRFRPINNQPRKGYITAGRQTPYMRKDVAIAACTKLGLELKVIGQGPEHIKLTKNAGSTITFLTDVTDEEMPQHFQTAEAFILPGKEDFGIVAVEAMAAGTPVIAFRAGGALDYVIPGQTGEFFDEQSAESLTAIISAKKTSKYNNQTIVDHAKQFSLENFKNKITDLITK